MGDSQILDTWTHAKRKLHIFSLELKAVILALRHWITVLWATKLRSLRYQHTGRNPFSHPVTSSSGSVPMTTNSRHSHNDQTHSRLSDCDSRPSISTKSANNNNRVESPSRNSESILLDMGNSNSGHVCHSPHHASSPVYISDSGASSSGDRCSVRLAGEVDVQVSTFSPAQQVIQN